MTMKKLEDIASLVRYYILISTTAAGSGHPTSSLSAADLMVGLMFGGGFHYDPDNPSNPNNDRLIFSKGHAAPLLYALWAAVGKVSEEELLSLRTFGSPLEGHPVPSFPYAEAATGSLGQGLGIGLGMALNARYLKKNSYRTYVLLGDGEMLEGSQWEALQIAAHYKLDNLIGIIDVNRLGQAGETMHGRDSAAYTDRIASFGWDVVTIDGHSYDDIVRAFAACRCQQGRPHMIVATTVKGKGVSFLEDRQGWHGKALDRDELERAIAEIGPVRKDPSIALPMPEKKTGNHVKAQEIAPPSYELGEDVATRTAYGRALARIFPAFPQMVVLDAEVNNSTRTKLFKDAHGDSFFEMYIAEQNMVSTATGLALRGRIPFVSSFGAFLSRAHDQIRMSQYADVHIVFCGSHAGISIGADGPSQMALEDLALFRSLRGSAVVYPCDAVSTERLVEQAAAFDGLVYIRTTRDKTPVLYSEKDVFEIGGFYVLKQDPEDELTIIAAGITVHEALAAHAQLLNKGVHVRVIDLYTIKPVDAEKLGEAVDPTRAVITVEDHYPEGGIGETVRTLLGSCGISIHNLAVERTPRSGTPEELRDYAGISCSAIIKAVAEMRAAKGTCE